MPVTVENAERVFKYGDLILTDTSPSLPPVQVLTHYSGVYPELINGMVKGPVVNEKKQLEYQFETQLGEKG